MSTTTDTASRRITEAVTSWPGVTAGPAGGASSAFRLGRRELGHLHGDRVFHVGFPKPVWHELFDQGRIDYHPVFPGKPGFASRQIASDDDVRDVIAMIRINYERAVEKHGLPQAVAGLHALAPERLPFAPEVEARAFLLERDEGNVLIYSTTTLDQEAARLEELGASPATTSATGTRRSSRRHRSMPRSSSTRPTAPPSRGPTACAEPSAAATSWTATSR